MILYVCRKYFNKIGGILLTDTKKLKILMMTKGISREELAEKLGVSTYITEKKINGDSEFNSDEIDLMCEIFDIRDCESRSTIFFAENVEKMSTLNWI